MASLTSSSEYCKGCNIPTGICLNSDGENFTILPGSDHVIFLKDGIYHLNPKCHPNLTSYNPNIKMCVETIPSLPITEHSKANKKRIQLKNNVVFVLSLKISV